MDPIEAVRVGHDTTFALLLECQRRGHALFVFEQRHLAFRGRAVARMRGVHVQRDLRTHFSVLSEAETPLSALDAIFLRKDPPVDAEFVHATQLVELCGEPAPVFVNRPAGILGTSEKLFALQFKELVPETFISNDLALLRAFAAAHQQGVIVKPLDGFGGQGVLHCRADDRNLMSMLELATRGGRVHVVAQEYLEASRAGDKRVLLVDGEPRGAVLRVPRADETRANMAVGGRPERAFVDEADRRICAALKPHLLARGLHFVGIDVIGGKLIEVNVTSPTGVCEVDELDGVSIETEVVDLVERMVREKR